MWILPLAAAAQEAPEVPTFFVVFSSLFGLAALAAQGLVIALQVYCAVHVFRNHRDRWWLFAILFVPFVGSLVYIFVEVLPEKLGRRTAHGGPVRPRNARKRIRVLEEEVRFADTVQNRAALAEAYFDAREYALAAAGYKSCLQGLYADDANLLHRYAEACCNDGQFEEALRAIEHALATDNRDHHYERILLRAVALDACGKNTEAEADYREAADRLPGIEGRCRYARFLEKTGRGEEARRHYGDALRAARHLDGAGKQRDRKWIRLAKEKAN